MISPASLQRVRAVADAVLYEGYLLYPYRASSSKNQSRWQFGVLGPSGAAESGVGEEPRMSCQTLMRAGTGAGVNVTLRFLQLQVRSIERAVADSAEFVPVDELTVAGASWLSWDEAVEREFDLGILHPAEWPGERRLDVHIDGGTEVEELRGEDGSLAGRVVRTRWPAHAVVTVGSDSVDGLNRVRVSVENVTTAPDVAGWDTEPRDAGVWGKDSAIRQSLIGAHLILAAENTEFVSLLEPPVEAEQLAGTCAHERCYPVLAGLPGETDLVLVSPIILYDHPEVAEQSDGALFDATEIDEILTLRVMTLTEEEKRQARATDPLAAQIIDRCDQMSPATLAQMHGILRDPHVPDPHLPDPRLPDPGLPDMGLVPELTDDMPWWDPDADTAVRPDVDGVVVNGVRVAKGTVVRIHPSRRADAQDLFFAGQLARVVTVHADVDGGTHVGVVLVDDPASELHEWYGRYLYFAPDEVEPVSADTGKDGQP
ncbi:hypothetical protein R1X32_25790 [Rhodococcus opacus]|uniref:Uncharacterized protein n=1 Tax=Rhodococcus opacus TaxID=37919 RepID=A0AAX3YIX8_RHOOP|nr:hypothetical protein [Rhodococcus opacus]ELB89327.1 hypothetical protein Rwratislav_30049 [Rhodococcus wratislaviensis IFP 2016]MCZ4587987.1 hypothetical protein [Rhodococcus opacus]MDV6243763.1 hypothetical protein [Rhodococcus opacus]MDX5969105.1 hypothetical protein [Rhodococcus opacus]NKY72031.1 hypothetical protein [Rhodococcus opacus]